jgi:LiaI-LiaF-like transmembrane region
MQINRGLLFWGLALVVGGAVALAVQFEYLDRDTLAEAWRLWPLILVAIGLAIILSRTPFAALGTVAAAVVVGIAGGAVLSVGPGVVSCGGADPTSLETHDGSFSSSSARTTLDFNCGTLTVDLAAGSDWTARTGSSQSNRHARIDSSSDSLTIRSPENGFNFGDGRQRWEVTLGSDPTYDLSASPNAADTTLDLAGGSFSHIGLSPNAGSVTMNLASASVDDLRVSLNAGSLGVTFDGGSDASGRLGTNAGSVEMCTTSDTAIRLTVDANITFSHNLDSSGLNRSGDTWTSDGYDGAAHRVTLTIEGNAASFTLNPSGGCS